MTNTKLQEVKRNLYQTIDIVDLVQKYLPVQEDRRYWAVCPWHKDDGQSLELNTGPPSFRCLVCGEAGDALTILMRMEQIDILEAEQRLADEPIDIVEVASRYTEIGDYEIVGHTAACPWHADRAGRMKLNSQRNSFWCPVCQFGGDIFSFTMLIEKVSHQEAVDLLAEAAGIE